MDGHESEDDELTDPVETDLRFCEPDFRSDFEIPAKRSLDMPHNVIELLSAW